MEAVHTVNFNLNVNCHPHCENCCPRWLRGFSCLCPVFEEEVIEPRPVEGATVIEPNKLKDDTPSHKTHKLFKIFKRKKHELDRSKKTDGAGQASQTS